MPIVCINRPNRSERRRFRFCDAVRIAKYVYEEEGNRLIRIIPYVKPGIRKDLEEYKEVIDAFLDTPLAELYVFKDEIERLKALASFVDAHIKALPKALRAIMRRIGVVRLILLVLKVVTIALKVVNSLVKVYGTLSVLRDLLALMISEYDECIAGLLKQK